VGTTSQRGLNHIIGPKPADNTQCMESKTKMELETLCLAEASQRFMQASKTPFLTSLLIGIFTEANLMTKAFNQVLEGTFICPKGIDSMTQRLLIALKCPPNITPIQPRKLEEITEGWQKAREATLSSPSSIHFGHYMVGMFNPIIAVFNARLANLGFTTGYSLKCWQTGLNVMLEKLAGNFNMEKLCIILLFEGDFNQNNKWLEWAVMFHTKTYQQMAPEQYGCCKEQSVNIQCLNK